MKPKLSIQAFSVRDAMTSAVQTAETFRALASYGYTGVQAFDFPTTAEDYADAAQNAGLDIIGTLTDLDLLLDTAETVRILRVLGTTNTGICFMPGLWDPDFSVKHLEECIVKANLAGENLHKYGIKFHYHHHTKEFTKVGNETMMEILVRELNPKTTAFMLDTYWLQHSGVNILEWLEKLAGRMDVLHLKDKGVPFGSNDGVITELGSGNINFREVLRVARAAGVKDFCYEQDCNFAVNALESAKQSADYFYSIIE